MENKGLNKIGKLLKVIFPIILGIAVILIVGFLMDETFRNRYFPLITAYFLPPLGKESVIPYGILRDNIHPVIMALSIAFVDIVVGLFLLWNYDFAKKIPIIGKFIIKVENKGKSAENKYKWVKSLRFLGVVLFVMIPFQGSGGLVGTIIGRLTGMKPLNVFYAISIGALIGCSMIAAFAKTFLIFAEINTTLTIIVLLIIVIVILIFYLVRKRRNKRNINKKY